MRDCEQFAQIAQDKWATVSESLRSFRGNERPGAICSGCSEEMSDVSKSLISLTKNEQLFNSLKKFWLKKSRILLHFVLFKVLKKKLRKNERIAHFCSFPLFWWAMWVNRSFRSNQMSDVSELLISFTKNERPWAIREGRSEEMSDVSESLISLTNSQPCAIEARCLLFIVCTISNSNHSNIRDVLGNSCATELSNYLSPWNRHSVKISNLKPNE